MENYYVATIYTAEEVVFLRLIPRGKIEEFCITVKGRGGGLLLNCFPLMLDWIANLKVWRPD